MHFSTSTMDSNSSEESVELVTYTPAPANQSTKTASKLLLTANQLTPSSASSTSSEHLLEQSQAPQAKGKNKRIQKHQQSSTSSTTSQYHSQNQNAKQLSSVRSSTSSSSSSSSGMRALMKTMQNQFKSRNSNGKTRSDYQCVQLFSQIRSQQSMYMFGDVHLEYELLFLADSLEPESSFSQESSTLSCTSSEPRFTCFQFWRPCLSSEHRKQESLIKFNITSNMTNRSDQFSNVIALYRSMQNPLITTWANNVETFQAIVATMKPQTRQFFDSMIEDPRKAAGFNYLKQQFHDQVQAQIQQLDGKRKFFLYYYGGVTEQVGDFQIDSYGISEAMLDVLGTNSQETISCLSKYGFPYFMTQRTRLQRYMNDFEFLLDSKSIEEVQNFITLDDYKIQGRMRSNCYQMQFSKEQLATLTPEIIMFLRIALHFRVDVYEFDHNALVALASKRKADQEIGLNSFNMGFNSIIFKNELLEKYY